MHKQICIFAYQISPLPLCGLEFPRQASETEGRNGKRQTYEMKETQRKKKLFLIYSHPNRESVNIPHNRYHSCNHILKSHKSFVFINLFLISAKRKYVSYAHIEMLNIVQIITLQLSKHTAARAPTHPRHERMATAKSKWKNRQKEEQKNTHTHTHTHTHNTPREA